MNRPTNRGIFREAALRHHARRKTPAAAGEIPRPPIAVSGALVLALVALAVAGGLHLRVPEYASGRAVVEPGPVLSIAVPREARPALRTGQTVLIRAPSGELLARTRLTRVEPSANARLPRELDALGAVYDARVEIGRESVLSHLPVVDRLR